MIHAKVMMMKISKSKRQLAQMLIDAGVKEFPNGADWAAQGSTDLKASFYSGYKPNRGFGEDAFCGNYCGRCHDVQLPSLINNWYQTVLSCDEFDQIVAEIVAEKMLLEELFKVLEELDPNSQRICGLLMEGHSKREIARIMSIPQSSFEYQFKKLMASLKSRLESFI